LFLSWGFFCSRVTFVSSCIAASDSRFVGEKQNRSFAFSYPILERQENSTVYLKHCSNDLHGWQIVPKAIDIVDQDNLNVVLKFNFIKNQQDLGQLYYRDSWVYEGQRYLTNNFAIDPVNPVTTIYPSNNPQIPITDESGTTNPNKRINEIIMENSDYDASTTITVNLNSQVARGNYMVFSKIVDSFGQPIAELNWFAKLKGGIFLSSSLISSLTSRPSINFDILSLVIFSFVLVRSFKASYGLG